MTQQVEFLFIHEFPFDFFSSIHVDCSSQCHWDGEIESGFLSFGANSLYLYGIMYLHGSKLSYKLLVVKGIK